MVTTEKVKEKETVQVIKKAFEMCVCENVSVIVKQHPKNTRERDTEETGRKIINSKEMPPFYKLAKDN